MDLFQLITFTMNLTFPKKLFIEAGKYTYAHMSIETAILVSPFYIGNYVTVEQSTDICEYFAKSISCLNVI